MASSSCSILYLPAQPIRRPMPVIVFLHGGGWSGGTRTTGPDFSRYFARDGFAMASIEYRLTPSITFPANVEDVRTAVRWLKANAAAHALDPDRICLWGTSAGGHLAAVAALAPPGMFEGADNLTHTSSVRCVLDAYGPTRFDVMDAQTEEERATLQPAVVTITLGGGGRGTPAAGAPGAARTRGRRTGASADEDVFRTTIPHHPSRGCWGRRAVRSGPRARRQPDDLHRERRTAIPHHARSRGQLGAARSECPAVRRLEACRDTR